MSDRKYIDTAARSRAWRERRPQKARETSKSWRQRNPAVMALLNKRVKTHHRLCVLWVKDRYPEMYRRFQLQARGMVPAVMIEERTNA